MTAVVLILMLCVVLQQASHTDKMLAETAVLMVYAAAATIDTMEYAALAQTLPIAFQPAANSLSAAASTTLPNAIATIMMTMARKCKHGPPWQKTSSVKLAMVLMTDSNRCTPAQNQVQCGCS